MRTMKYLTIFLILVISRTRVFSFNIETRNPIVKKSRANTYFGFSVAQHVVNKGSHDPDDYWILVGAPLGKNLQPLTNRSGALFKCPISTDQEDCIQIETDGHRIDEFEYDDIVETRDAPTLLPPKDEEIKEDQWLGVNVRSQKPGGKVVVCAHRYIQSENLTLYHYGRGLCYLLNKDLETKEALEPCQGLPTDKLHQQYGYCQVGTSLAILDDGFTLMGSPGPFTWRGTVFAKMVEGEFLDRDKRVYKGPLNDDPTPIDKYSYLGMSVAGGHFFNKNEFTYVAGAPRSNFNGQVYFFNKTTHVDEMAINLIISGSQFGSSFGYEILAVDIDNDGYDELLVAAPFYYDNNKGGAVYLYQNLRDCTNISCEPSIIFTGKIESRFGFSMTSLGDINKDSYKDVAIGAPYEGEGGAIYIFLGNENGLNKEPSQVIRPPSQRGGYGIKTVGYSMSGGLDMDLNDYPDLLVGAYESDMVILYKTRPIIDITITVNEAEMKNINVTKKGCKEDPNSNTTCFSFQTCFTLSKIRLTQGVDIKYSIKELSKRMIPRVKFRSGKNERYITVKDSSRPYCESETVDLIESNGDILSPIQFQVNYSIHNDAIGSPILNKTSVKEFEATFQKNCGNDDICKSYLTLTVSTPLNVTGDGYTFDLGKDKELRLDIYVNNSGEAAYEAKLFVEHPKDLSYVAVENRNAICTSNNQSTLVICNLGNPFQEKQFMHLPLRFEIPDTKMQKLDLKVFVNSTSTELSTQTNQSLTVILQKIASYTIQGKGKPQNIFYAGEVKGDSAMKYFENMGPRVVHSYEVVNQGEWNIQEMQVIIRWPYEVFTNREEGGKRLLYLEKVPVMDFNGLRPADCFVDPPEAVNPLKRNSSGIEDVNGESLEDEKNVRRKRDLEEMMKSRWRRDAADVVEPDTIKSPEGKNRKIVTMDCLKATAKCATITCNILQLNRTSQLNIEIYSRVWNSTLMEDYSDVDWVTLKSVAEVKILDPTIMHSNSSISSASIETNAYPKAPAPGKVNIWIIIGAVIAGLILLILIIIVLCKCGFFKRNRIKDHTLSGNLKKQGESETLLKDNEGKPARSVS